MQRERRGIGIVDLDEKRSIEQFDLHRLVVLVVHEPLGQFNGLEGESDFVSVRLPSVLDGFGDEFQSRVQMRSLSARCQDSP
jgi:hypothetical protein